MEKTDVNSERKRDRFIHLSDLHFCKLCKTKEKESNMNAIIEYIGKNHRGVPVLITGDIVQSGYECQFTKAKNILKKLAETNPILMVPGNHDYNHFGNIINLNADKNWKKFFGKPMGWKQQEIRASWELRGKFERSIKNWLIYKPRKKNQKIFDGLGIWGNKKWVVFGIDSGDPDDHSRTARGWVSPELRYHLKNELEVQKEKIRIVMLHHHPFWTNPYLVLDGAKELMNVLRGNCEVLLFGHKHQYYAYNDGKQGIPLIISNHSSSEYAFSHFFMIQIIEVWKENGDFKHWQDLEKISLKPIYKGRLKTFFEKIKMCLKSVSYVILNKATIPIRCLIKLISAIVGFFKRDE